MTEPVDLRPIADWLDQGSGELQSRILRRLGTAPRGLPGRTWLALEEWALPCGLVAALIFAVSLIGADTLREDREPVSIATLFDVSSREPPRAVDVYMVMRQMSQ